MAWLFGDQAWQKIKSDCNPEAQNLNLSRFDLKPKTLNLTECWLGTLAVQQSYHAAGNMRKDTQVDHVHRAPTYMTRQETRGQKEAVDWPSDRGFGYDAFVQWLQEVVD